MDQRPFIGITPSQELDQSPTYKLNSLYAQAIVEAGGLPIILPVLQEKKLIEGLINGIKGLLLSGGVDVNPLLFKEEPHPKMGRIDPYRDFFELEALQIALAQGKPCLGICRGCQVINVALGGTIIQDIPAEKPGTLKHYQEAPYWHPTHTIQIEEDSLLEGILKGRKRTVNSFHHQGVKDLGRDLKGSAYAPDGIIEAIEHEKDLFIMGIQWHPEHLWQKEEASKALFQALVDRAKKG